MAIQIPRKELWTAKTTPTTLPALQLLAYLLGFTRQVTGESEYNHAPSFMLDALAEAFYLNPIGFRDALKAMGVNPEGVVTIQYTKEESNLPEDR